MSGASPDPAPFADGRALVRDALATYLPPERITVSDYAAQHRWLDNRGGGYIGRWSHDEAPYLCGPMEALTSSDHLATAIMGPGRSGKTAVAENWLLQSVGADQADMLFYQPTDGALQSYVKRVINPMIEQHSILTDRLGPRPVDRSLHFKNFRGMWCEFLHAAYSNLIGKSAPRIVVDEIDAVPENVGDVYELVNLRRQTFGHESMVLVTSHPDRPHGVARLYGLSDQRRWFWPCPHCNGFSSPNPDAKWEMELHYRPEAPLDEIAQMAALVCPHCGAAIEGRHRRAMNLDGCWVGCGQDIAEDGTVTGELVRSEIAGFWIVGVMSPFIIGGIGALARAKAQAEREFARTGDDKSLRDILPKRFGIPYERKLKLGSVDAAALAERTEAFPLGTVPEGVRFLTVAIDVQNNRFELLVRGWGVDGESWVIDVRRVAADPAVSPADWDDILVQALEGYPLADDTGRVMRPRAVGFDSGGATGVTQQAYAAWRRARAQRQARFLGKVDGRDAWSVMPTKGLSTPNAPRLQVTYPNSRRKDRDARATGAEPLVLFNPNRFKDDLAGQLLRADAGPLHVHFPGVLRGNFPASDEGRSEDAPHLWFEQLTAEQPDKRGLWVKLKENAPNEALDLMVGTHVMAELHGLSRIRWERPPGWAAEWDRNVLVGEPGAPADPAVRLAAMLQAAPPAAAPKAPSRNVQPAVIIGPVPVPAAQVGPVQPGSLAWMA
jgi:phage terminase large subunit GpA-like protein